MNLSTAINALVRQRRATFVDHLTEQAIDKQLIEQLLENANWAPSHGKTEPWRFIVFTGDGRKKLADFLHNCYVEITPKESFNPNIAHKFQTNPLKVGAIIGVWMERQATEAIPEVEEIQAVACAIENLWLSTTALGLAGYWASPKVIYSDEFKEAFGLGAKDRFLALFYLGYPKETAPKEGKRKDFREKTLWIEQ